ncbi:pksN [Symbiodinium necroappetens]|uniref:PksN protein n=1 Tax=Symbiodinium necroappetens TaxID=1628268 RepID=A0A813BXL9_9DINO|nr:pksN [Symbiodinium necroappetens]
MFFFRLRPYITSVTMEMCGQRYSLSGPSGAMSTILPAVDALLGIRNTSAELREAVKTFEGYVPKEHRQFLDGLRNAPSSVRSFIKAGKATLEESMWYALAGAYNACISRVLDFRHISDSQVARITLGPKGEAHTRQESAEASISAKHANLPVFGDVTNGHFWDPTGPNGFVTNRCGNLPGWGPGSPAEGDFPALGGGGGLSGTLVMAVLT